MIKAPLNRTGSRVYQVTLKAADFDFTQANQTAQNVAVVTIPAFEIVESVNVLNIGSTVTSSGTLTGFNVKAGNASGGTQFISATDLTTAGSAVSSSNGTTVSVSTTNSTLYIGFTPVGTGANWNTITSTAGFTFDVLVITNPIYGEAVR
jgi:hypothetical protein